MLVYSISLLAPLFLGLASGFLNASVELDDSNGPNEAKTIYIDLAKVSLAAGEQLFPSIALNEVTMEFAEVSDGVFSSIEGTHASIFEDHPAFVMRLFAAEEEPVYSLMAEDGSILADERYNYICLDWADDKPVLEGYGCFGEKKKNPGATYATQRVWMVAENKASRELGSRYVTGYMDSSYKWTLVHMEEAVCGGTSYWYADIPYDVSTFSFIECAAKEGHCYIYYGISSITQRTFGLCYFFSAGIGGAFSTINVEGADRYLLARVVEAYLTYGKSPSNGTDKDTVTNLFRTWFEKKSATSNDLKDEKILDYTGYSVNGNTYDGLEKNSYFSVNEKWNTMCSNAGIDPSTGLTRSFGFSFSTSGVLVTGISLGFIAFVALFGVLERIRRTR